MIVVSRAVNIKKINKLALVDKKKNNIYIITTETILLIYTHLFFDNKMPSPKGIKIKANNGKLSMEV